MLREVKPEEPQFEAFTAALAVNGLPIEDLLTEPYRYFAWRDTAWGGIGAGEDALLRSVLVAPYARGSGEGRAAVQALVDQAKDSGVRRLWLLTTDASAFFTHLGWSAADRTEAPEAIRSSQQFSSLCPASATLTVRSL